MIIDKSSVKCNYNDKDDIAATIIALTCFIEEDVMEWFLKPFKTLEEYILKSNDKAKQGLLENCVRQVLFDHISDYLVVPALSNLTKESVKKLLIIHGNKFWRSIEQNFEEPNINTKPKMKL